MFVAVDGDEEGRRLPLPQGSQGRQWIDQRTFHETSALDDIEHLRVETDARSTREQPAVRSTEVYFPSSPADHRTNPVVHCPHTHRTSKVVARSQGQQAHSDIGSGNFREKIVDEPVAATDDQHASALRYLPGDHSRMIEAFEHHEVIVERRFVEQPSDLRKLAGGLASPGNGADRERESGHPRSVGPRHLL